MDNPHTASPSGLERLFADFPPVPTAAWERRIEEDLEGADYAEKLIWRAEPGLALRPFYRAEDLERLPHLEAGPAPAFRRAPGEAWEICQDVFDPDLEGANAHARAALQGGAHSLGFVLHLGADGLHGIPVQTQAAFERLVRDLPLGEVPISFAAGEASPALLAMLLNEADRRSLPADRLQGALRYDPLAQSLRTGHPAGEETLDRTAALLREAGAAMPAFRTLSVDGQPYHEAGAPPSQELGYTLAAASEYLAGLSGRGIPPAEAARRLQFVVPVGPSFFREVAKLRALRLLFRQLLRAYGGDDDARPFVHAVTSRRHLTLYDPYVNLLRGTTAAAAAVLGGCDALSVRPFDEPGGRPGDLAYRLARNLQLILFHEAHFARTADPSAGAYYVEVLTDRLARAAWTIFQEVEARGGFGQAVRDGYVQAQIEAVHREEEQAVARRRRIYVGTNRYPDPDETRLDEAAAAPGGQALRRTGTALPSGGDPLAALREALRQGAALGDLLPEAVPTEHPVEPLPAERATVPIEALRLRTERITRQHGRPAAFLLPLGHPGRRAARAGFARDFFGCAGYAVHAPTGFDTAEAGVEAALASGAGTVVLCSSDEEYAAFAPEVVRGLRARGAAVEVIVAGYPLPVLDELLEAGVHGFIHLGSSLLEVFEGPTGPGHAS